MMRSALARAQSSGLFASGLVKLSHTALPASTAPASHTKSKKAPVSATKKSSGDDATGKGEFYWVEIVQQKPGVGMLCKMRQASEADVQKANNFRPKGRCEEDFSSNEFRMLMRTTARSPGHPNATARGRIALMDSPMTRLAFLGVFLVLFVQRSRCGIVCSL
jgi:hypothetical protein